VAELDRIYGTDGPWAVLPSLFAAPHPVCGEYPSAGTAYRALTEAGFLPSARFMAPPALAPTYDPQTVMRYRRLEGDDVVLARRAQS